MPRTYRSPQTTWSTDSSSDSDEGSSGSGTNSPVLYALNSYRDFDLGNIGMGDLGVGVEMEMAIGIPPRVSIRPSGEVRRRPSSNHGPTNNGSGAGFQPSSMPTTTSNTTTTGPQTYPIQSRYTEEDNMILRTGEASRLRRRGALRLDYEHAQLFHATHTGGGMGGVWLPTPGEDGSAPSAPAPSGVGEGRRHRRATTVGTTARGGGEYSYILVCGGTIPSSPEPSPQAVKFNPSPLPLFPPTLSSQKPTYKTPQKASTTTGCGAIISMYTAPRPRVGVWAALSAGVSEAVVPMEKEYFEGVEDVLKGGIVKSACGCVKEGVGCRVCGNPLGTIYKPCNSASSSLSPSTCFIHKLPPGPTGPLYYSPPRSRPSLGRSSSNSSSDSSGSSASGSGSGSGSSSTVVEEDERGRKESYSYTFFPSCVSSLPSYIFPERTRRRSALNSASEGNNYVYSTPGYPYSTGTGARDVSGYRSHGVGRDQGGDRGVEEGGEEEGDGEGEWTFVSPFVPPVDGAYVPPEVYARFGAPGPGSQPASAAPVQSQGEGGLGTRQGGGGTPTSIPPATPAPAPAPVRDEALRIRGSDGEMYFPSMTTSAERAETGETVGGLGLEVTDGSGDVQDELRELEQEAGSEEREPRTGVPREEQAGEQREGQAQGEGPREGEGDASRTYLTIPRPRLGVNARYPYVLQPFYSGSFATPSVVPAPPSAPSVPSSAPPASGPPGPTASSPTAPDWWEALAQRHGTGDEDVWGRVDADSWGSDWAGIPQSMQTMTPRRERERERAPRREERIRMMFDAGMRRDRARALRRQSQSQTLLQAQALIRAEVQSLSQDVGQAAEGNEVTLPIRAFSSPTSASYPVYPTPHPSTFQYRYSYPSSSSDSSDEEAVESMVRRRRRRTQSPEYPASWREDADDVADVADYLLGLDYVPGLPGLETQVQTQTQTQPQTQVQAQGQPIQVPREMLQGTPFGDLLDMQRDSAAQARIPSGLLEGSPFTYGIDARPNQNQAQVQSSRRALLRRRPTRQRGIYISISSPSSSSSEDSESSEDEAVAALPSYPTGPVSRVRGIDRLAGTGTQTERSGITILVPSGHSSSAASPSSPLISPGPFIPSPRWHSAPLSPTLPVRPASPSPPNTPPPFNSAPSTSATMAASASQPSSPSFSDLLRSATSSGMEARLPLPLPSYFRSTASTASEGEWGQGMGMWSWGVPEAGVLDPDGEIEVDPDGDGVVLEEEEDERKVPSGIWFDR